MATSRRWLQFSLRGFLVMVTIGCLWLGRKAEQAHKQAAAIRAIEALGAVVQYDWQTKQAIGFKGTNDGRVKWSHHFDSSRGGPPWMHGLFQKAEDVYFFSPIFSTPDSVAHESIPHLKRLPWLKYVHIATSEAVLRELKAALPGCEVWPRF
jgi:hypothetical protein